jgi:hypothetical protein
LNNSIINIYDLAHPFFSQQREKNHVIVESFIQLGVSVTILNLKNRHMRITGKSRDVDFYANTGTIHARPVKNKFPEFKSLRGLNLDSAILKVVDIANNGY